MTVKALLHGDEYLKRNEGDEGRRWCMDDDLSEEKLR